MNHPRQTRSRFAAAVAAGLFAVSRLVASPAPESPAPQKILSAPATVSLPAPPQANSPVDMFRKLLAMTPAERHNYLTNRPAGIRDRILAKLHEYEVLDPNERELRLRATELRWYLLPLLHVSPTNRAAELAAVPDVLRPLVKSRLAFWDILPPPLQKEFFESEPTLHYFTQVDSSNSPPLPPVPPGAGWHRLPNDPDLAHWNTLPAEQHRQIAAQFTQFFELTPAEKKKTLNTLSDAERLQMEKTLDTFGKLPPAQRFKCIRAFTEFAGLSAPEKQEFLNNAQRWAQLTPKERQTWRDLVTHVPEWSPLPSALILPPIPPAFHPPLATNRN